MNRIFCRSAVSLLLASLTVSAAGELPTVGNDADRYYVAVVEDVAQGPALLAGDYAEAIDKLADQSDRRFSTRNNLCAAYIAAKDLTMAEQACDVAVSVSQRGLRHRDDWQRKEKRREHAYALTNRGVAAALTGRSEEALRDFQLAVKLDSTLPEPAANLRRLESKTRNVLAEL
ncbi:MAG: hypothetical protein AB8G17_01695 [Gammaproteobacteria bacterium]